MRVLITGGAGFIGSHLGQRYLERGDEVFVLDDLSTGSKNNIAHLLSISAFHFREGSVLDREIVLELVEDCDAIIHLAAAVGVKTVIDNPLKSIMTNIHGTEVALEAANKFQKKIFIASSSEVYGKNNRVPFTEEDNLVYGSTRKHRWSYACSKAMDEFMALAYHRNNGLPVVIGRFFNTVGPGQTGQYGMVIPRLVEAALKGQPLIIYGDGSQSRTFTHVKDTVSAIISLMNTPQAVGEVVNIGGSEEITITELAQRIIDLTGSQAEIQYIPYNKVYPEGFEDLPRRVPNTEKLFRLTGLRPQYTLQQTLTDTINFIAQKLGLMKKAPKN